MASKERFYTDDGYGMLNAVCDEFRRLVKAQLLESKDESVPLTPESVLEAADCVLKSPWLDRMQGPESDDTNKRAA